MEKWTNTRLYDAKCNVENLSQNLKFMKQVVEFKGPQDFPLREILNTLLDDSEGFLSDISDSVETALKENP